MDLTLAYFLQYDYNCFSSPLNLKQMKMQSKYSYFCIQEDKLHCD